MLITNTKYIASETPIIGFVARSGTGKTTLLCKLLPLLKQRGYRVALIKHSHHRFDIDRPGKDSHRLREAGADQVLLASPHRWALMVENQIDTDEPSLQYLLEQMDHSQLDLILVEGFKNESIPKIELNRATADRNVSHHDFAYHSDNTILAIATDTPLASKQSITQLDINDPATIADYINNTILKNEQPTKKAPDDIA
ncbi:MAG: molybdopterin-guanine dinucleotide biosynthesis protein B [Gammaproteobacteria bacterium]|nr:molybdopterin-guanine dinucleotide biosynthesis protein B [Gammaproteobacteria bacterium]